MKYIMTAILTINATSLFAHADCANTVEKSAFRLARPNGNNPESSLFVSVGGSNLVEKNGQLLTYEVQIDYDINDGASSDSFPSELYLVSAKGTEKSCKVTGVWLKK